jgi:predicted anti-sigma-YlaC factor YlaD
MEGKMNCDEYKDLITISVFGELTSEELTQLKTHLRDCSKCSAIYESSGKLSDLSQHKENSPLPDKEKSWQIISAKALKRKGGSSLLRQESLNMKLREIGKSTPLAQSDERPLGYLLRTLISETNGNSIQPRAEQTSPLVDLALTLIRHINQSDVY